MSQAERRLPDKNRGTESWIRRSGDRVGSPIHPIAGGQSGLHSSGEATSLRLIVSMSQRDEEDRSWEDDLDPDRAMEDLREGLQRVRKRVETFRRDIANDAGEGDQS